MNPRLPQPNSDEGVWGDVLNQFLLVSHNDNGTLKAGTVADANIVDVSQAKVTGLSASLAAKADTTALNAKADTATVNAGLAAKADATATTTALNGKANTTHSHVIADVSGLQAALDSKAPAGSGGSGSLDSLTDVSTTGAADGNALVYSGGTWSPANVGGGTGSIPDDGSVTNVKVAAGAAIDQSKINGLTASLAAKADSSALTSGLNGKANTTHTHAATDITSGTIAIARLGSGTPSATTFLRGDNTWATPAGGGDGTVTAANITDASATGRTVLTGTPAAARTAIGAVTVGTTAGTALDGSNAAVLSGKVTGTGISLITKLTQAEYTALSTKVATTLYVIVG